MSGSANRSNGAHLVLGRASLLAALIAALAAILLGTTASASAAVGAENRVGGFNVAGEVLVGPPEHIHAGQRLGNNAAGPGIAVATGVAANAGPRTLDIGGGSFPGIAPKSVIRTPDGVVSVNPNVAHAPSVVGRSQQLSFADNSFTNVTMNHFPADQFGGGTLSEVARVLRPGGTLSITTGLRADTASILSELQGLGFSTQLRRAEGGIPWITGTLG